MDWSKIISASVVPVVIISACGLLCLAFYNRLSAVIARLRQFQREMLNEVERQAQMRREGRADPEADSRRRRLVEQLQWQSHRLLHRARLLRRVLQCHLSAIASLILCSACLGFGAVWPQAAYAAAPLFILGLALMLIGMVLALIEVGATLQPIEVEHRFVEELAQAAIAPGKTGQDA